MQVLLILTGLVAIGLVGFIFMIIASPYSRRCWGIWLLTTANALDEMRAAKRGIESERRIREDEMRVGYGIDAINIHRPEKSRELVERS